MCGATALPKEPQGWRRPRRRAAWSRWSIPPTLLAGLDERGIAYVHLRGLGTPKEGRLAARSGDVKTLTRIYNAHLKTPQAKEEMDEVATLVRTAGPVCLLCFERDHRYCHRTFIAEIIEEREHVATENLVAPQI
jgi:uncharacterized protein (DUF488 family)